MQYHGWAGLLGLAGAGGWQCSGTSLYQPLLQPSTECCTGGREGGSAPSRLKLVLIREQICLKRLVNSGGQVDLNPALLHSRFAKYYRDAEGVDYRTLIKAYGIRFDVMVNGKVRAQARKSQSLERKKVGTFLGGKAALG